MILFTRNAKDNLMSVKCRLFTVLLLYICKNEYNCAQRNRNEQQKLLIDFKKQLTVVRIFKFSNQNKVTLYTTTTRHVICWTADPIPY